MITIDSAVPTPVQARQVRAASKMPKTIHAAVKRYKEAYVALYGVAPEVTWRAPWIRIHGQPQGVTLHRLKEMTKQLKWRAG